MWNCFIESGNENNENSIVAFSKSKTMVVNVPERLATQELENFGKMLGLRYLTGFWRHNCGRCGPYNIWMADVYIG